MLELELANVRYRPLCNRWCAQSAIIGLKWKSRLWYLFHIGVVTEKFDSTPFSLFNLGPGLGFECCVLWISGVFTSMRVTNTTAAWHTTSNYYCCCTTLYLLYRLQSMTMILMMMMVLKMHIHWRYSKWRSCLPTTAKFSTNQSS